MKRDCETGDTNMSMSGEKWLYDLGNRAFIRSSYWRESRLIFASSFRRSSAIGQIHHNRNVKLRVVFLDVRRSILLAKFLYYRGDLPRVGYGSALKFPFSTSNRYPDPAVAEQVLVPLRVRALYRQQIQFVSFKHEPDGTGDGFPRLSADDADLDLTILRKTSFQFFICRWHA